MKLNENDVNLYNEQGWLVVPDVFAREEISVLESAAFDVLERRGPEVSRETDGQPHVCWGMHLFDERLGALARHPDILCPAEQLLDHSVFVHQSRINIKQTNGSIVEWHQDYGTYHRVDGIPEPRGIMIAIFLDDVSAVNAPLLAVPGSHREGIVSTAQIDPSVPDHAHTARYRYDIEPQTMGRLVDTYGLEAITATAGSVLFMNMTVVHGSSVNISPLRRLLLYINVSATDNRGETFERPEFYAARDFTPLTALDRDCLKKYAGEAA
ncbi:MAG: phytanoyl-CoA dioxygenase family protein [Gammaproteobacteria bacterium]|nr:phytanoyl-CoA dioxygenase family protein [Gammaproteobacteria bacterium]